jgi:hypothetical protein
MLDAGTGAHSLSWVAGIAQSWVAVTADPHAVGPLRTAHAGGNGEVMLARWEDETLLAGEVFDVVLADYLVGAVDRFTPYYQMGILERLRRHCRDRLYLIGLEPWPATADTDGGRILLEMARLRDAAFILAGDRPYREYPSSWVADTLGRVGFEVASIKHYGNLYKHGHVTAQLRVAERYAQKAPAGALRAGLLAQIDALRRRAMACAALNAGVRISSDYIIVARAD